MSQLREILTEGYLGNLPSPASLQAIAKLSDQDAARYCLVSPETYRRWKTDRKPHKTALKLLTIRAGHVPWPGWEKYLYCQFDGLLYHNDLKYGFAPSDLLQLHWLKQERDSLRIEREGLIREVSRLREKVSHTEDKKTPITTQRASNYLPKEWQENRINIEIFIFRGHLFLYIDKPKEEAGRRRRPTPPPARPEPWLISRGYEKVIHYAQ